MSAEAEKWLRKRLPRLTGPDPVTATRVRQAIGRARMRGYVDPAAIRMYVLLCFALGPHFDERMRVREHLSKASGSLDQRLLGMARWSHANCWLRDPLDLWDAAGPEGTNDLEWPAGESTPAQLKPDFGFQLDVPQLMTPATVVTIMLDLAELTGEDVLIDLGSGDGRVAIEAARRFGLRALGVDIDPLLVATASAAAEAAGVADRVTFRRGDLHDANLDEASVVILYLLRDVNLRLRDRLLRQLRPGSRIISRSFDMGDWEPDAVVLTDFGPIYRWRLGSST